MDYPKPHIPLSPVLSWPGINLSKSQKAGTKNSILDNRHLIHVSSGRSAIALALEETGVATGDEVLVPAFHCESMVSPVTWRGAAPVFYRVRSNTEIDLEDLASKINSRTKVIIAAHYFGFIQNLQPVVDLCREKNLMLVEDCAHAFFGSRNGKSVGSWGDFAIASSMKFFPVYDGGILCSQEIPSGIGEMDTPAFLFQIKSAINVLQNATSYERLGILGKIFKLLAGGAESVWRLVKKMSGREHSGIAGPSSSGGGYSLDETWIHRRASGFSKLIIEHQNAERIIEARRKNYLKLQQALADIQHTRPLFEHLPEGVVPLVFPLYVEAPALTFSVLKNAGVPIWRFGEYLDPAISESVCSNSVDLSAHVFQFPCHQELSENELDWMIEIIASTFANAASQAEM